MAAEMLLDDILDNVYYSNTDELQKYANEIERILRGHSLRGTEKLYFSSGLTSSFFCCSISKADELRGYFVRARDFLRGFSANALDVSINHDCSTTLGMV